MFAKSWFQCGLVAGLSLLAGGVWAASAKNNYVEVSSSTPGVVEVVTVGLDFHITTANVPDAFVADVEVEAASGWRLLSPDPASFKMSVGEKRGYEVCNENNEEDKAGGDILLFKVDVEIDGVGEDKEVTEGAFVGYAECDWGFDPACVAAMKPVKIRCLPANRPDGERIVLTFPPGHLLEKVGTTYQAAQSSYKANEIGGKSFWLHGHAASGALRDYEIKAEHSVNHCKDEAKYTVIRVGMSAYRPTTEGPAYGNPFAKHEVPDDLEESPGAGIRVNKDDDNNNSTADRDDTTVNNENDLIEVVLNAVPPAPSSGFKYILKRSAGNIKVWNSQTKGAAWLDANDETTLTFSTTPMTVWVENPNGGSADLELIARSGTTDVCSDKVHFYPFSSVVVLFEGEFGVPSDPPGGGISTLALAAYTNGYDVHVYDEPDLFETPNTEDAAFAEIDSAVENRGVTAVAIIGYSHGGGSTYNVSVRLDADATAFNLAFTAYIDAISQPLANMTAENRRPVRSAFHVNYYQVAQGNDFPLYLDGTPSVPAGAGFEDNVDDPTITESHTTIDDAPVVQDGIRTRLFQQVNR